MSTAAPKSREFPSRRTPGRVAAVHACDGAVRVVVTDVGESGLRVQAARSFEALAAAVQFVGEQGPERVVRVVPGGEAICRTTGIPRGTDSEMLAAAALQGEARLPDATPAHRRAAGVILGAAGEPAGALQAAWHAGVGTTGLALSEGVEETWCPVLGALAALRGGDDSPAWFADSGDGSISLLSGRGGSVSARVVVEDSSSAVVWGEAVESAVGSPLDDGQGGGRIGLGEGARAALVRVPGAAGDGTWVGTYGLALGAVMAWQSPLLRPLAQLRFEAPTPREHPIVQGASWLARPRNAGIIIAASLTLLVLAPLGLAKARLAVLDNKSQKLAEAKAKRVELDRRAAVYAELAGMRWPLSKLLSDISRATPQGVVVHELRLIPEQGGQTEGDQGVTLRATAEKRQLLDDFIDNLKKTKLFGGIKPGRTESREGESVDFDLTFGVVSPHENFAATPEWDWAQKPLAVRLYGEGSSNKTPPVGVDRSNGGSSGDRPVRRSARATEGATGEETASRAPRNGSSDAIPEALTDDQISKLDRATAMREMTGRRKYAQSHASLDASTKRRLDDEVTKLKERMRVLANAAGSAGGAK